MRRAGFHGFTRGYLPIRETEGYPEVEPDHAVFVFDLKGAVPRHITVDRHFYIEEDIRHSAGARSLSSFIAHSRLITQVA